MLQTCPKSVQDRSKSAENEPKWSQMGQNRYKMVQRRILGDSRNSAKSFRGISPLQPAAKKNLSKLKLPLKLSTWVENQIFKKNRKKNHGCPKFTPLSVAISVLREKKLAAGCKGEMPLKD